MYHPSMDPIATWKGFRYEQPGSTPKVYVGTSKNDISKSGISFLQHLIFQVNHVKLQGWLGLQKSKIEWA